MKTIKSLAIIASALVVLSAHGQNTIQFNSVTNTEEGAIRLSWASNSNEVYQIQCTDTLIDTNTGLTPWQVLYDHYPSHGTNTFWLDTGNYGLIPIIVHPKYSPTRFYRIFSEGTNSGESPFVTLTGPTNGSVLSDVVTVSVMTTSSYPNVTIKLFVDGQEMNPTLDGTNFNINTCEWPNGPHTLFATAKALSGFPGPRGSLGILEGQAVSTYVPVSFSNLITKIAFSQWFFEPSLGQTQEVTATFGANVDWTLQVIDESSNAVRTATGSGTSLVFDWDGTGDGGTNIPDGVYYYQISAETNGGDFSIASPGGRSLSISSDASESEIPWVLLPSGGAAPLEIYPPGMDTNGMTIVEASSSEIQAEEESSLLSDTLSESIGFASPAYAGPSGQSATAPSRPPTASNKNAVNTFGLAYWDYDNGRTLGIPATATFTHVHLDGLSDNSATYDSLISSGFSAGSRLRVALENRGWKQSFEKHDNNLSSQEMRRSDQGYFGGELFTTVTLGVFLSHGSYGTDPDSSPGASNSRQVYFPSGNPADNGVNPFDNGWLRMCQFGFGGSLKWMNIGACFTLRDDNFDSMSSVGGIPLKGTHLIIGAATTMPSTPEIYTKWGDNLLVKKEIIAQAWFDAGTEQFRSLNPTNDTVIFRVVGYPECILDTIATNVAPTTPSSAPRNLTEVNQQVFPSP